jgi:hypothetical protein
MSSINATPGTNIEFTSLIKTGDGTANLTLQTNSINAIVIDANQNANCTTTGAITIPSGTSNARPTGVNGMIRYNTSSNTFEAYLSGSWTTVP